MLHTADNFEPLRHLAGISQHRFIECNIEKKIQSCKSHCLQLSRRLFFDAISPNGRMGDITLSVVYLVARWIESSHETAVVAARQDYVKRFYLRFWYNAEQTFLSQCRSDCFQDRYFAELEKRRATSIPETYTDFQLTRIAMGW